MKRKWLALFLALVLLVTATACGSKKTGEITKDKEIVAAVEVLENKWREVYQEELYKDSSGYFEIKNTRKIEIQDTVSVNDTAKETIDTVDYIVEFVLFTEYYGYGHVSQAPLSTRVIVYDDGRMEVGGDLLTD